MRCIQLCLTLALLAVLLPPPPAQLHAAQEHYVALPRRCPGILPPDAGQSACCMFGYVYLDGQAVAGSRVTITTPQGTQTVWTEVGSDSPTPYYSVDLSSAPLRATVGTEVTIRVDYGSRNHTISHVTLNGGQQVDIVIPLPRTNGYAFDRQFWSQAEPGEMNEPAAVVADSSGAIYVVDRDNARVQVFDAERRLLVSRGWGTRGGAAGQFVNPQGIAVNRFGDIYVVDGGNSRVQKFSATGQWLTMWGRRGTGALQFKSPRGIALAPDDTFYVADTGNGRVQRLNPDGSLKDAIDRADQGGDPFIPLGVVVASDGTLYVSAGSAYNENEDEITGPFRVQRRNPGGSWTVLSSAGQLDKPLGLALGADGSLLVSDTGNSRVLRRSNAAGSGTWSVVVGPGNSPGELNNPEGIAFAADGGLLVADTQNDRMQRFSFNGSVPADVWGSRGSTQGQFDEPTGLALDSSGNLYVADTRNDRIQKLAPNGQVLAVYDVTNSAPGGFNRPEGVAVDSASTLYVTDTGNSRIQIRDAVSGAWTTWGSYGEGLGSLFFPSGIAIGPDGFVYVAEMDRNRIQFFTGDGQFRGSYGLPNNQQGTGPGEFNGPRGLAFDRLGNLYVTERYARRVQRRSTDGVWTIIGGPPTFGNVDGVAIDQAGNAYVADTCSDRIQKINATGNLLASFGQRGSLEGEFQCPAGVAVSADGMIYVADTEGDRIQRYRPGTSNPPVATIVSAGPLSVAAGSPIALVGQAQDSQTPTTNLGYEWRLNGATTPFNTSPAPSLSTTGFADGVYRVSLTARSADGRVSAPVEVRFTVGRGEAPPPATPVKWGMLLYLAGDNLGTEQFMNETSRNGALWRLARAGANANVTVAAIIDGLGPDNTRRFVLAPDGTSYSERLTEANMGDPQTLVEFARWGMEQAKADRYFLALADHADALDGIAFDTTSGPTERLTNVELRSALSQITDGGARPIDVLQLDGCLMGTVENAYQVRGLARTLVASANLGWSAFAYEEYRALIEPTTSAVDLARDVARRYATLMNERQLPFTITALNLEQIDATALRVGELSDRLLEYARAAPANRAQLVELRRQAQKYDSNADLLMQENDGYIDLRDWTQRVRASVSNAGAQEAATRLLQALGPLQLFEDHRTGVVKTEDGREVTVRLDNAHSLGIYYPPSAGIKTYDVYVRGLEFPAATRWDSLLADSLTALPPATGELPVNQIAPLPFERGYRIQLPLLRR